MQESARNATAKKKRRGRPKSQTPTREVRLRWPLDTARWIENNRDEIVCAARGYKSPQYAHITFKPEKDSNGNVKSLRTRQIRLRWPWDAAVWIEKNKDYLINKSRGMA